MLIRDAIDGFFAITGQAGATHSIGQKYILTLAQMALNHMWSYKGYNRTRQHRKDSFITTNGSLPKIITSHPIVKVDKFYSGEMTNRDGVNLNPQSFCEECPGEGTVCVPCACECNEYIDLGMRYANPQDKLVPGFFQISGSEHQGMGGLNGNIIRVSLPRPVDSLWVTYYRGVPQIKSFDEKFPLPIQFMNPFCYYMAFIAIGRYGQFRANEETGFFQVANLMMDDLKELSYNAPGSIKIGGGEKSPNTVFYT